LRTRRGALSAGEEATMIRIILTVLAAAVIAGCNTMHGLGKDIERGGENIQHQVDKNRR
jgi:predicted small secreted protein